jgi:hypothetical protein
MGERAVGQLPFASSSVPHELFFESSATVEMKNATAWCSSPATQAVSLLPKARRELDARHQAIHARALKEGWPATLQADMTLVLQVGAGMAMLSGTSNVQWGLVLCAA